MNQLAIVAFYTKDTIQAIEYWKEGLELITKENLTYSTAIDFLRNCGILNIEIETCVLNANKTTLHQRPNNVEVNNFSAPYVLQQ